MIPERISGLPHRISTSTFKVFHKLEKAGLGLGDAKNAPTKITRALDLAID